MESCAPPRLGQSPREAGGLDSTPDIMTHEALDPGSASATPVSGACFSAARESILAAGRPGPSARWPGPASP